MSFACVILALLVVACLVAANEDRKDGRRALVLVWIGGALAAFGLATTLLAATVPR